jgi:hypothetical protein
MAISLRNGWHEWHIRARARLLALQNIQGAKPPKGVNLFPFAPINFHSFTQPPRFLEDRAGMTTPQQAFQVLEPNQARFSWSL